MRISSTLNLPTVESSAGSMAADDQAAHTANELLIRAMGDLSQTRPSMGQKVLVCAALFIPILLWLFIWPYSGDGDSVMHYLAARTVWADHTCILGSWARPLHKLLIIVPAIGGIIPARLTQAIFTIALAWQTISLASQLKFRNAILAAPLVVLQPYVFALASDTMTEIPMALALVIAMRLWMSGRIAWSCVAASILPLLRPEGFFFIAMWGVLLLLPQLPGDEPREASAERGGSWPGLEELFRRRLPPALLLCVGVILWVVACWLFTGNPIYFITIWSWPMQSYDAYPAGPIYHYVVFWPVYCGLILIVPFLVGVWPTLRNRRTWLVWSVWLLVFVLHSLLYWLHKFASVGLLRILACTSPMTAIICLEGFNTIGHWLARRGWRQVIRRRLCLAALSAALLWTMSFYGIIGAHYHCFGYRQLAREANARRFLADYTRQQSVNDWKSPRLIAGDEMFLAFMGLISPPPHFVSCAASGLALSERLASQPIGTVGAWDSEQAAQWHTISIDDLPSLGYTIVYEYDQTVPDVRECWKRRSLFSRQRYALIRKDRL